MKPIRSTLLSGPSVGRSVATLGAALVVLAAAACSAAATPQPQNQAPSASVSMVELTVTSTPANSAAPVVTAAPSITPGPSATVIAPPPPKPPVTAPAAATLPPLPNLAGTRPQIVPTSPTCGVPFVIAISMGNKGLAPTTVAALGVLTVTRVEAAGERFMFKATFNIPPLAAGDGRNFKFTKTITTSGHFNATYRLDELGVVAESRETDNVQTQLFDMPFGPGCGKV